MLPVTIRQTLKELVETEAYDYLIGRLKTRYIKEMLDCELGDVKSLLKSQSEYKALLDLDKEIKKTFDSLKIEYRQED